MRYFLLPVLVVVAACTEVTPVGEPSFSKVGDPPSAAAANETLPATVFNTQLRAENEPGPVSTSESLGSAQAKVFAEGTMEFAIVINNKSDETYTRAHIHKAAVGVNGPIHWDFLEAGVPVASIGGQPADLKGVARARTAAVLSDLLANPHLYYVNVHSTVFPGGAVRGQLR